MKSNRISRLLSSIVLAGFLVLSVPGTGRAQVQTYLFNQYTLAYQCVPNHNCPYGAAIASGDFNKDGRTDFALSLFSYPYGVQIILGQKGGTLALGASYTVNGTDQLENIVAGDFNRDGKLDLVAFDSTAQNYVIFLGNGDGTFKAASVIAPGIGETALVTTDLNRDGKLDLVTGTQSSAGGIQVILGNGDGTFQPPVQYPPALNITSIAVADVNKDGIPDVVAIPLNGYVQVLLGNGNGTLQAPISLVPNSPYPYSVAIGDINGDGNPDIVVGEAGTIDVFLGNGNGTFGTPIQSSGGNGSYYLTNLVVRDLNADRKLDVVGAGPYSINVWLGKGDGTFRTPVRTFAGGYFDGLNALLSGDFNNDSKLDLAVPTLTGTLISLFSGNGDGTFAAGPDIAGAAGSQYRGAVSSDLNGDGKADFVAVNSATGKVEVYLGKGTGSFQTVKRFSVGSSPQQVVAGDFNGDGKLDLAVTNAGENTISVLLGNGDGTFQAQKKFSTGTYPYGIATADLNGDGKLDLVVGTDDNPNVQVLLGNGDGTFKAATSWGDYGGNNTTVAIADINNDGKLDIAATTGSPYGMFDTLYGNGDGTFPTVVDTSTFGDGLNSIAALALQPSGLVDVIIGSSNYVIVVPSNAIGGGNVGTLYFTGACVNTAMVTGDFNGDGFPDVAVSCEAGSSVLLGKGDGTFGTVFNYANSYFLDYSYGIAAADFNSDGVLDVVVPHYDSGTITTVLSNPDVVFSTARLNFGSVLVGSSSTKSFTLTNQSDTNLTVTSITITGGAASDYTETNTCDSALRAGALCTVTVTFKPTVTGTRNASVTFKDSEAGPARTVALLGSGK